MTGGLADVVARPPFVTDLRVWATGVARYRSRRLVCAVGRCGVTLDKREGDGAAPVGVFRLEAVLHRPDRVRAPMGSLPTAPIRVWDGWCDDPDHEDYNQPIRLPHPASHERLHRQDPLYDLLVVFDANRHPTARGAGSALFLHVWRRPRGPTAGCIAFSPNVLRWIIETWTPRSRLVIHA